MTATPELLRPQPDPVQSAAIAPGGPDPHRFDVKEAWYPVHYVEDLDPQRPTRFTLLGQDVVIWWDPQGQQWRVFADRCPHRLVPLSEGRINPAGQLECPYHGWAFAGSGECQHIPQQPEDGRAHTAQRACAQSFPTAVAQGLLFVYPGTAQHAPQVPLPLVDPLEEDPDGWLLLSTFRDVPYDALTLLENVLDVSHIPFTPHETVGKRDNAAPMAVEMIETGKQGFRAVWPEGPRRGTLGSQYTRFVAPALMYQDLTSEKTGRVMTVVYATPMEKGRCRLFARFPFKFSSPIPTFFIGLMPRWWTHLGNNRVLEDDQIFLHLQERALAQQSERPYAQRCYLPTDADRYVLEYRRWVDQFEADPFPDQPFPPALDTPALLDRYQSHVQHCGSCRRAYQRIQALQRTCGLISAVGWSAVPGAVALGLGQGPLLGLGAVSLVTAGLGLGLGRLRRAMEQGQGMPPRNRPEKGANGSGRDPGPKTSG